MKSRTLAFSLLASLLCSCAATSVKTTWKSPDVKGPVGNIVVIAIEQRESVRKGFENRLVNQLAEHRTAALVTYDQLSLVQIKEDKRAAAERFRAGGAQAVLILRLADKTGSYSQSQVGVGRYGLGTTGLDNVGWHDYYYGGFMGMTVSYGTSKEWAYVEAGLYDLKTEKRLWAAVTQTVLPENMDRVGEMDTLVGKIINAMQKDGLIP
jgi:hypothetical protein